MKKPVVLLLVLILLLGCTALAEEAKPILFRGLPWGSSYSDVKSPLDLGSFHPLNDNCKAGYAYSMYKGDPMILDEGTAGYADGTIAEVAGYPVDYVRAGFVRVPGADGLLTELDADTAMYYAFYRIRPADLEAAMADLTSKLSGLYGETDLSHEGFTLWHGAEGTAVSLQMDNDYIYIRYGFEGADDLCRAAQGAVDFARSQNVDGL